MGVRTQSGDGVPAPQGAARKAVEPGRDLGELRVHTIAAPGGSHGERLHWFRIEFDNAEGRCFITTDEAQRLRQLTTDWVRRALENLAHQRGWPWLRETAAETPGLMLHCSDAGELPPPSSAFRRSPRPPRWPDRP
jgi:hypothetical protein